MALNAIIFLKSGSATCYSIITAQDDNDMMYHDLSSLAAAVAGRRSLSGGWQSPGKKV